jgi:PGF-pre-PGF domain-containing protein
MLASGPPDGLLDDSATTATSGTFSSAMRFGSQGPTIYDYVLISMPYTAGNSSVTGLNESGAVNMSIPTLYDENWNVAWSVASNGTSGTNLAANDSHYSTYASQWETLMSNNTCHTNATSINATHPCYVDTTNNRIWVRLPHFSGTGPAFSGSVITAATSSSAAATSSSESSGSSGSTVNEWSKQQVESWLEIKPGAATIMKNFDKEMGIKEIQIEVNNLAKNPMIIVKKYNKKPAAVSVEKIGTVYKYLEITPQLLTDKLKKATVTFQIEKSWLSTNGITMGDISVSKFDTSSKEWKDLTATCTEGDSTYNYCNVELNSFSYFAISGKTKETTPTSNEGTGTVTGNAVSDQQTGTSSGSKTLLIILIAAVIAVVAVGVFYFLSKQKKKRYMLFGY